MVKIGDLDQKLKGIAMGHITKTGRFVPGFFRISGRSHFTIGIYENVVQVEFICHIEQGDIKTDGRLIARRHQDGQCIGTVTHSRQVLFVHPIVAEI